jgi:hypothetical protein
LTDVKEIKENLLKQMDAINARYQSLIAENQDLQKSISKLQDKKADLMKQVELARAENIVKADNFQVDAYRNAKKERLTIRARRTRMLSVTMDVPKDMVQDIKFNITTPDGKQINETNKALTWQIVNEDS